MPIQLRGPGGNLISDGVNTYNSANRLVGFKGQDAYGYNGLGDRLSYYSTTYTLDLAGGLPQVLNEGTDTQITDTYIYGQGRIADDYGYTEYYLGDALGSLRQVIDEEGLITLTQTYAPYGEVIDHTGYGYSNFGFTGEMTDDNTGLVYLRARYYAPYLNQFIQPDTIVPDEYQPADWNRYAYVGDNPVNYVDPSGYCKGKASDPLNPDYECWEEINLIETTYTNIKVNPGNWKTDEVKSVEKALRGITHTLDGSDVFSFVYNKIITISRAGPLLSWLVGKRQADSAAGPGIIKVYDAAFDTNYDLASAYIIHEFGHLLDSRFGFLSMDIFRDKFWNNCRPDMYGTDCSIFHRHKCIGVPASVVNAYLSPGEDFADLFAYYVWGENGWNQSMLWSDFMPPDTERTKYMMDLISAIKIAQR